MVTVSIYDSPNSFGGIFTVVTVEADNAVEAVEAYKLAKAQLSKEE